MSLEIHNVYTVHTLLFIDSDIKPPILRLVQSPIATLQCAIDVQWRGPQTSCPAHNYILSYNSAWGSRTYHRIKFDPHNLDMNYTIQPEFHSSYNICIATEYIIRNSSETCQTLASYAFRKFFLRLTVLLFSMNLHGLVIMKINIVATNFNYFLENC